MKPELLKQIEEMLVKNYTEVREAHWRGFLLGRRGTYLWNTLRTHA